MTTWHQEHTTKQGKHNTCDTWDTRNIAKQGKHDACGTKHVYYGHMNTMKTCNNSHMYQVAIQPALYHHSTHLMPSLNYYALSHSPSKSSISLSLFKKDFIIRNYKFKIKNQNTSIKQHLQTHRKVFHVITSHMNRVIAHSTTSQITLTNTHDNQQ